MTVFSVLVPCKVTLFQLFRWYLLSQVQSTWVRFWHILPHRWNKHVTPQSMQIKKIIFKSVRKIAKTEYYLRHVCSSVGPSVCFSFYPSAWNNSASTGRIFMKLDIWVLFENLSRKFKVPLKSDKEDQYTFLIITSSIFLRVRNVSDRSCRENQNPYFMFNNFFFFRKSFRLWDNVKKHCRAGQTTDGNMAHAHLMSDS